MLECFSPTILYFYTAGSDPDHHLSPCGRDPDHCGWDSIRCGWDTWLLGNMMVIWDKPLYVILSNKRRSIVKTSSQSETIPSPHFHTPPFIDQPCRRRILTIQPTGRLGFQPSRMWFYTFQPFGRYCWPLQCLDLRGLRRINIPAL